MITLQADKFPHGEVRRIYMAKGERDFVFGDIVANPELGATMRCVFFSVDLFISGVFQQENVEFAPGL